MSKNTRKLEVERSTSTAHRLLHYDGVCGNVHGHNMDWEIGVIVSMENTGDGNMPLDLKDISSFIDEVDHAILLNQDDPLYGTSPAASRDLLGDVITFEGDPTCELISQWMADRLVEELPAVLHATVRLAETEKYTISTQSSTGDFE